MHYIFRKCAKCVIEFIYLDFDYLNEKLKIVIVDFYYMNQSKLYKLLCINVLLGIHIYK